MPRVKKNVAKEIEHQPIKEIVTQAKIDDLLSNKVTTSANDEKTEELHENLRNRNKGKQNRKH